VIVEAASLNRSAFIVVAVLPPRFTRRMKQAALPRSGIAKPLNE
jgi:hypothetical protein